VATALVTGGAGFIGSHIVDALLDAGMRVHVLDDFSTGRRQNLSGTDIQLFEGDLGDPDLLQHALRGVQYVFHQAALVSVPHSLEDPIGCYHTNLMGSLHLLQRAKEAGIARLVLASSAAVYATSTEPVGEDADMAPLSPYAASKLGMETCAEMFTAAYDLPTICLRYFNVYGPRQPPDSPYAAVIPIFINSLLSGERPVIFGDGEQRRDFIYVQDVVRANLRAIDSDDAVGEVINISAGEAVSINELASTMGDLLPHSKPPRYGPPRPGDIRCSQGDISRAARLLKFRPRIDLAQGLEETVEWFRVEHGNR
jgi:nucleoside-diphosphate-sugar epimerase